jgi:subtilisin family serine protease
VVDVVRRRRISELTGEPPPGPGSVFGPDDDNVVPGEVILALEADAAAELSASIPSAPVRGGQGAAEVTALGATELDDVLRDLDVRSVSRVHGPSPTRLEGGIARADDLGLEGTLRIRYAAAEEPGAVAERLAGLDQVAWAEPNRWREAFAVPNDPRFGSQWGLTRIECPGAWDLETGDPGIVVAVIDTGVDLNHPELAPLLVAGQDLVDFTPGSIPKPGWVFEGDFTGVDADAQDEVGHGTHVAGTICCRTNDAVGVAGVAWNVRLMPVKVLARIRQTATGRVSGSGSAVHIAAGIRWAVDHGARVLNMSLGGYADTTVEREAVAYAVSRGAVVVAAMGNDDTATPSYPAAYPGVIAVAATDSGDRRASFSNRGPHIDLAAPGVGVLSTYWDNTYATADGTSMASPHVAGVAALMLSRNGSLTADQVGNLLRSTAKPLRDTAADPVPNDRYGHGLVQAAAAVRAAAPVLRSQPILTCIRSVPTLCQRSLATVCPSITTLCASQQIVCQRSVRTVCVSQQVLCPSLTVACPESQLVLCQRSVACPSAGVRCPSLACHESLACGSLACGPGGPGGPGPAEAEWSEYDPYGYDPYGSSYA